MKGERPSAGPREGDAVHLHVAGRAARVRLAGAGPWVLGRSPESDVSFPDDPGCSRAQARISRDGERLVLEALSPTTPTLLNGAALSAPTEVAAGDVIGFAGQRIVLRPPAPEDGDSGQRRTSIAVPEIYPPGGAAPGSAIPVVDGLVIGRAPEAGAGRLSHPNVSRAHARIAVAAGAVAIQDLGSTNGTFVNGARAGRSPVRLRPGDRVDVGPFALSFTGAVLEPSSRSGSLRLVGARLVREVTSTDGSGRVRILDDATVVIQPREFVGIIGPSGSGKSTLMNALSARERATGGRVFLNDLDLYAAFEALKRDIALVPQHNILHELLTLREALDYTGRLRLPRDLSAADRSELVEAVARSVELGHRLDAPISKLSGGQKKRASLASETLSRPGVLFLDEVTSGLDESTDRDIMRLLRRMADQGMTIVCVTHTLANIEECCHRVVVMANPGVLAFSGPPAAAKRFFGVDRLGGVFDRLAERDAGEWRQRFAASAEAASDRDVADRPVVQSPAPSPAEAKGGGPGTFLEAFRHFGILVGRNARLLRADTRTLAMAATQCAVIGLLLGFAFSDHGTGPTEVTSKVALVLLLGLSTFWLGCNGASKEIVGERPIFLQERNVNLSTGAFVLAKFLVASAFTLVQVLMLYGLTALLADSIPGGAVEQLLPLAAAAVSGTAFGLMISSFADTRDQATTLVPLGLVPQFILSGVIVPQMPAIAQSTSEAAVTGYWIVEAMRAVYVRAEAPIVGVDPATGIGVPMEAAAGPGAAIALILLHALVCLALAYGVTRIRSR